MQKNDVNYSELPHLILCYWSMLKYHEPFPARFSIFIFTFGICVLVLGIDSWTEQYKFLLLVLGFLYGSLIFLANSAKIFYIREGGKVVRP